MYQSGVATRKLNKLKLAADCWIDDVYLVVTERRQSAVIFGEEVKLNAVVDPEDRIDLKTVFRVFPSNNHLILTA
jgi:hypothetical protein